MRDSNDPQDAVFRPCHQDSPGQPAATGPQLDSSSQGRVSRQAEALHPRTLSSVPVWRTVWGRSPHGAPHRDRLEKRGLWAVGWKQGTGRLGSAPEGVASVGQQVTGRERAPALGAGHGDSSFTTLPNTSHIHLHFHPRQLKASECVLCPDGSLGVTGAPWKGASLGPRGMPCLPALAHAVRGVGARLRRLVRARPHSARRPEGLRHLPPAWALTAAGARPRPDCPVVALCPGR